MKVRIKEGVSINGVSAQPGDVVEVSDYDGRYLIGGGRAEVFVAPPAPEPVPEPAPAPIVESKPVVEEAKADSGAPAKASKKESTKPEK